MESTSSRTARSRQTPRSRSVGRSRDEDEYRQPARAPLPSGPRMAPSQKAQVPTRPQPRSRADETSTSSSGSSFLDRMKMRGGDMSSRTSLEDEYEERPKRSGGWASTKNRRPAAAEREQSDEEGGYQDSDSVKQLAGYGYDLWGRVTAVAGSLTVNVSKAWEKGIGTVDGEETPPGQESRLTKAMKAYHLDRARSPADLPAWLFEEHERGAAPRAWSAANRNQNEDQYLPESELRQRSGLRDIYDKAAASSSSVPISSRKGAEGVGTSGAANRLKEIREAKRSARQAKPEADVAPPVEDRRRDVQRAGGRSFESTRSRSPPRRVGLPSGPGRGRRL